MKIFASRPLLLCTLVFMLSSCASPDSAKRPVSTTRSAQAHLNEAFHARSKETRIGSALAAADKASLDLSNETARAIYNSACVEVMAAVESDAGEVSLPAIFNTSAGAYRLEYNASRPAGAWAPASFTELLPTSVMTNKAFVSKEPPSGYGGALVGVSLPPDPRKLFLPRKGVSAPVTAVVNFSKPLRSGDPTVATVTLCDPAEQSTAHIAGKNRELSADLSAPFGFYPKPGKLGLLGAINPAKYLEKEGLFLIQPYDPDKIPIVFIHGLMSVPQIWLPAMAVIEEDPLLRGKYQFWVYAYPTGSPIAYSALRLRETLAEVYKVYPQTRDMVIINHSLGGDITHLQVIDSGDVLVKGIFKQNTPKIMALPDDSLVKRALIFESNPRIDRVVFIAAPHRGAPMAVNTIGEIGAALIRLPFQMVSQLGAGTLSLAISAAGEKKNFVPNSVTGLSPDSPLLTSMNEVPMKSPFHSIIGVYGKTREPLEETSDTVVPYRSSHQDAALSEKIVPAKHTTIYKHPETIAELKRILRLHLKGIQ